MEMSSFNFDNAYFRKVISKSPITEFIPSVNQLLIEATQIFYDEFDCYPNLAVCAPGTFTIMGEYMELAGGFIVQAALPLLTLLVGKCHHCPRCRAVTCSEEIQHPRRVIFPIGCYKTLKKGFPKWANLLKGVANVFLHKNKKGFDVLVHSSIPVSRGFGSSAALQAAFYTLLESVVREGVNVGKNVKAKKCRIADEKFGEAKAGAFNNYTTFYAESRNAIVLDSFGGSVEFFSFRDPNILFLLSLPTSDLLQHSENLIRMRESELKLAAKLLGLNHIMDAEQCHLQVLASMNDPTREEVTAILKEFEKDKDYISLFVEELFRLPKSEYGATAEDLQSSLFGEHANFGESYEEAQPNPVEDIVKGESFMEFEYKTICDETICLGGLSDVSVRSDLSVMSKLIRRLRYVITETMRIRSFIKHVTDLDYTAAGVDLTRSHLSLKVDFEVSSPIIDELVQFTAELGNGVYGSKMMRNGGTLTLLHRNNAQEVIKNIKDKFGDGFRFYLVFPSRGVRRVNVMTPSPPKSFLSETYPTVDELLKKAVENFEATYHRFPTHGYFAPGGIKVLGDHSDYNRTYALIMAVEMGVIIVGGLNGSGKIRAATTADTGREPQKVIFQIPSVKPLSLGSVKWANYIRSVISRFKGTVPGFDCLIESSIPAGCRTSSSAALLVCMYGFLEELTGMHTKDYMEKADRCMKAEQTFINSLCGIDDFVYVLKSLEQKMILFDCKKCTFTYVPSFDSSLVFVLLHTSSTLRPSKSMVYMRLEQCYDVERALGLDSLRCVKEEDLEGLEGVPVTAIKRARHIITEKKRVLLGVEALRTFDAEEFGRLMVDSHISLRDDFGISCRELDTVVERAMEVDGVFGARMTGSAYGSLVVCLVKRWAVDDLMEYITDTCGDNFDCYLSTPSNGSKRLDVKSYVDSLPGPKRTFEKIFEW